MRSLAVAVTLVLALAACGNDASSEAGESIGTAAELLTFEAETVEGGAFDSADLVDKDVVLWFWAPWCTECRREAPLVAQSQADNPDVTFVGVAGLGEVDEMQAFVDDYGVEAFEHLTDLDGALWQKFGVVQQPAYAFIDDSGTVEVVRGEIGADGIADGVAGLTAN